MSANERQVGGTHYRPKRDGALQHWDICEAFGLGYLESYATKYLTRCMVSGKTEQDLEKARHCIEKLIEIADKGLPAVAEAELWRRAPRGAVPDKVLDQFFKDNAIENAVQRIAMTLVLQWRWPKELHMAASLITYMRDVAHTIETLDTPDLFAGQQTAFRMTRRPVTTKSDAPQTDKRHMPMPKDDGDENGPAIRLGSSPMRTTQDGPDNRDERIDANGKHF